MKVVRRKVFRKNEGRKVGRRKVDGNKEDIKTKGRKGMKVIRRKEGK